jgi:quercetin dioxygenase-like cupin family protein
MRKYFMLVPLFLRALLCSAQVPVSKEPRHYNVFENTVVRVLDVHVPPKDTSEFHKHETPSVFIVLTPAKTGSEVIMEEIKATALSKDATISFEGFYIKPRIHRVWNEDTTEFHVMDIEILNKKPHSIGSPIQQKGFQLLYDEKPVRAYRLMLEEGKNIHLYRPASFLIVGLTDALQNVSVNKKSFSRKGDFLFIPRGHKIEMTNTNQQPFSLAVLEFK